MRKVVTKVLVAVTILGTVYATAGCKKLLSKKGYDGGTYSSSGGTSSSSGGTANADDPDDQLQEKLDEYIKCLNSLSSSIHGSQKRYLSLVPKTGPTGHESWADIYKLPDGAATKCQTGVSKAKNMPPKNPALEQAGDDFAKAAVDLDPQIATLNKYFENKDYRDDKWSKAKTMHNGLMASFEAFNKADNQLHSVLDGITKPLAVRTLQKIEKEEGKKYRYHRKHVLNTARDLVETADPSGPDDAIDFNLYSAAHTELENAIKDLHTYGDDPTHKKDLENQKLAANWPVASSHYDSFIRAAEEYLKESKDFFRCLRDAPAKAKNPNGKVNVEKIGRCPDGPALQTQDEVVKKYNEFIRTSNTNQFP